MLELKGPKCKSTPISVSMYDNFRPHITWDVPTRASSKHCLLTNSRREQKFYTWLAALNCRSGEFYVLKTLKWHFSMEIAIDPTKSRGCRAKLTKITVCKKIKPLAHNLLIPNSALYPPSANSIQLLIWHPSIGKPILISKPKCIRFWQNKSETRK